MNLNVSSFDLSECSNVQNRCLAGLALELERTKLWAVQSKSSSVAKHEA